MLSDVQYDFWVMLCGANPEEQTFHHKEKRRTLFLSELHACSIWHYAIIQQVEAVRPKPVL